jgi:hypothetical protein
MTAKARPVAAALQADPGAESPVVFLHAHPAGCVCFTSAVQHHRTPPCATDRSDAPHKDEQYIVPVSLNPIKSYQNARDSHLGDNTTARSLHEQTQVRHCASELSSFQLLHKRRRYAALHRCAVVEQAANDSCRPATRMRKKTCLCASCRRCPPCDAVDRND